MSSSASDAPFWFADDSSSQERLGEIMSPASTASLRPLPDSARCAMRSTRSFIAWSSVAAAVRRNAFGSGR